VQVLIESVPNYSEGRRLEVVDALAAAVAATPGVHLLDRTSDASHNRSVLTLAGESDAVTRALEATVEVAIREIDMEGHAGEHPRIGAVDVVPFVPLGETTMDQAIALARTFGRGVAERFGIPVFLYARAAMRPDRRLADVRLAATRGFATRSRPAAANRTSDRPARTREPARWPSGRGRSSSPGTSTSNRPTWISRSASRGGSVNPGAGCRPCRRMAS
jgi:glutamate formiminotransferase